MQFTEARKQLSSLYSRLSQGGLEVIERNHHRGVVAVNADEFSELLDDRARFHVEITFGENGVAAWLQDLPVHAEGDSLDEALDELASALVDYASAWEKVLKNAPNHAPNRAYVRRVQLAGSARVVREMLEADAARDETLYVSDEALAPA